jgi:hypothetical protein
MDRPNAKIGLLLHQGGVFSLSFAKEKPSMHPFSIALLGLRRHYQLVMKTCWMDIYFIAQGTFTRQIFILGHQISSPSLQM